MGSRSSNSGSARANNGSLTSSTSAMPNAHAISGVNNMHASVASQIDPNRYVTDKVGLPTLTDIIEELARPGRDPRQEYEPFSFAEGINKMEDLSVGMKLSGIITNVTAFGAFVDIGVHQDGLVHISNLANKFVSNPADEVKVQQQVWVTVLEVDLERKRVGLSMKG